MGSFLKGGLTPFGFETLTPDWLDIKEKLNAEMRSKLEEISKEESGN